MREHKKYRAAWEKASGETIPTGWHIHHLDGDSSNNSPANLICVSPDEHLDIHKALWERYGKKRDYYAATFLRRYSDRPISSKKPGKKTPKWYTGEGTGGHNRKAVIVNGVEYRSAQEASEVVGCDRKTIQNRIRQGKEGYLWKQ